MISPERLEILHLLEELSEVVPEVRLGQLVANLSYLCAACQTNQSGKWKMRSCWRRLESTWNIGGQSEEWAWLDRFDDPREELPVHTSGSAPRDRIWAANRPARSSLVCNRAAKPPARSSLVSSNFPSTSHQRSQGSFHI